MEDYLVRAIAANGQVRAFAAYTKNTVEAARQAHNTSPVVTAGLGRLLTAGAMMGSMMKGDRDVLTIKAEGSGPVGHYLVTADSKGNVKGYAANPNVILPANAAGKLDVGGSLGVGLLTVIKDLGLKEPYTGTCELVSGEIAEDLTYYFASSEQTPSSVGLGVLMTKDNTVNVAGGFIIQLMPFAEEEVIARLEENLQNIKSVTAMLEAGHTPEEMLTQILDGMDVEILDTMPVSFYCNCSKERVQKALMGMGRRDLEDIIKDGEGIDVNCHFCNKNYHFTIDELKALLDGQE